MKKHIFLIILILNIQVTTVCAEEFKCWYCDTHHNRNNTNNCSSCGWDVCSNCGACKSGCPQLEKREIFVETWKKDHPPYSDLVFSLVFFGGPVIFYLAGKFIYNKKGYNIDGYDRDGYDAFGYNKAGYNRDGYNNKGYNKDGYDKDGYDSEGYNKDGYDRERYGKDGYNEEGYNKDGYNRYGYDKYGCGKDGYNKNGYDKYGYDKNGYDKYGYNKYGYDKDGYGKDGYSEAVHNIIGIKKFPRKVNEKNKKIVFSDQQLEYIKKYKSKLISVLYIPKEIFDEDFCKLIIFMNHNAIKFLPSKFITNELCQLAEYFSKQ